MSTEDGYGDTVSGLSDGVSADMFGIEGGGEAVSDTDAYREEAWDYIPDGDYSDEDCYTSDPVRATYRNPTTWQILKRRGIRAAVNYKCERLCMRVICHMHADARKHGYNLVRPDYRTPWRFWWFKLVSKLEFYTRPRK